MIEVTAEMLERGRVDRRRTAERRGISRKVREAREKLTSSVRGHRTFAFDLLQLYAERRQAAAPGVAMAGLGLAIVATHWVAPAFVLGWLVFAIASVVLTSLLASSFLRRADGEVNVQSWTRAFVVAEALQSTVWSLIIFASNDFNDPRVATFVLIAMLLVAAMNASVTASVSAVVYGALAPMTFAAVAAFHPRGLMDTNLLLLLLALGTLAYFVFFAAKLRDASRQALLFQAEKDDLIAELEQSKANSDVARLRAEESNIAKSRFLATMSHELRTPLNAILGFSEILKSETFGHHSVVAYKDYAADIHSSGEHLLTLINGILDLSRVEAGRYELHEEDLDLYGIVDECRHLVALRAKKKNIAVLLDGDMALSPIWADARAVRQIVLNLMSNAIKFTPPGGEVSIRCGAIETGGQFFSISDTGTGIPEDEIPIVMSSFGRGTFAHKSAEEGTGLGLPIVKGLVDLHGGVLDLVSRVREGTIVTVRLPAARVREIAKAQKSRAPITPVRSAA